MKKTDLMREFAGGEIAIWYEGNGGIHIKCTEPHNDPVEITEDDADEIVEWLTFISKKLRE
jgi:hypothetical protein